MKKKNIRTSIILIIIFIYIMVYRLIIFKHFSGFINYINIFFWLIFAILLFLIYGFPKGRNYLLESSIKIVISILMIYFILSYLLGLYTGFYRGIYSYQLIDIIKNVSPFIVLIISLEIVRYILLKNNPTKIQIILFIILMVILNVCIGIDSNSFRNAEQIFLFLSLILLPCIARECLYTYITYHINYMPSIIFRIIVELYIFVVPIMPDLGNYLSTIFGTFLPYIVYKQIKKKIDYNEKYPIYAKKSFNTFLGITISVFLLIMVILVSGIFNYKLIAIASNSMSPIYNRGDAIIYEKTKAEDVKEGDILAFKYNNVIITHRVMKINEENGKHIFLTKGDNNDRIDNFEIKDENVLGVVKNVIKFIAYPTIWISEL